MKNPPEEYVQIPMFGQMAPAQEAFLRSFQEAHGIPSTLDLGNEELAEILKPRPSVKPIVRRKRSVQTSCATPVTVTTSCSETSAISPVERKKTARKSTAPCIKSRTPEESILVSREDCKLVLLDLAQTNLGDVVKRLISNEQDPPAETKCHKKRSESTDSGLVTDEDLQPLQSPSSSVPPSVSPTPEERICPAEDKAAKRTRKPHKEGRRKRKKTEKDDRSSHKKPGAKESSQESPRPSTSKDNKFSVENFIKKPQPSKLKPPKLKGIENSATYKRKSKSTSLNRIITPAKPRLHYLMGAKNINSNNTVNTIALPSDVVATSDFDLPTMAVSPLCTKRCREPPPLASFSPYNQSIKNCCISCNKTFKTQQELAEHKLANHSAFGY